MPQEDDIALLLLLGAIRHKHVLRAWLAKWFLEAVGNGLLRVNVSHNLASTEFELVGTSLDKIGVAQVHVVFDAEVSGADVLVPIFAYGARRLSVKIAGVESGDANFSDDAVVSFIGLDIDGDEDDVSVEGEGWRQGNIVLTQRW